MFEEKSENPARGVCGRTHRPPAGLVPFWGLDYCQVSVLVTEEAATENMPGVLRALQALPPDEIAAKRRALRDVRDAFVLRGNSSPARPTAAEYILDEACHAAKDYAAGRVHQGARLLSSCFLEVQ